MGAVFPVPAGTVSQFEIGLVDERRRREGRTGGATGELAMRDRAQLLVGTRDGEVELPRL
jgi:hypothetical protein